MKIFRLEYKELPKPSKGLLAFMAEYFSEHDTGGEGIIAGIGEDVVADMLEVLDEGDKRAEELKAWWRKVSPYGGGGFDIQILTLA